MEFHDVIEPLAELVHFVCREIPVADLARQPQLRVAHLLEAHDLAETRRGDRRGLMMTVGGFGAAVVAGPLFVKVLCGGALGYTTLQLVAAVRRA